MKTCVFCDTIDNMFILQINKSTRLCQVYGSRYILVWKMSSRSCLHIDNLMAIVSGNVLGEKPLENRIYFREYVYIPEKLLHVI